MSSRLADREDFDSDREFVLVKAMRLNGVDYAPGQAFPKQVCNLRKLKQFYDLRLITMADAAPAYHSPTARFDAMSLAELRAWLTSHGVVPRMTWERGKLLEKAAALV